MTFHPTERTAMFIDGVAIYHTGRALGFDVNYKLLQEYVAKRCRLVRASYYTAVGDGTEFDALRPLVDWLAYNDYTVVTKPMREFVDKEGRTRRKGDMSVDMAVDVMTMLDHVEHVVLCTGDGDFVPLVKACKSRGKRVSVISTIAVKPPLINDELRREADHFIDLKSLQGDVARTDKPMLIAADTTA